MATTNSENNQDNPKERLRQLSTQADDNVRIAMIEAKKTENEMKQIVSNTDIMINKIHKISNRLSTPFQSDERGAKLKEERNQRRLQRQYQKTKQQVLHWSQAYLKYIKSHPNDDDKDNTYLNDLKVKLENLGVNLDELLNENIANNEKIIDNVEETFNDTKEYESDQSQGDDNDGDNNDDNNDDNINNVITQNDDVDNDNDDNGNNNDNDQHNDVVKDNNNNENDSSSNSANVQHEIKTEHKTVNNNRPSYPTLGKPLISMKQYQPSIHQPSIHQPSIHQPSIHQPSIHQPSIHQHSIYYTPHIETYCSKQDDNNQNQNAINNGNNNQNSKNNNIIYEV